MCARPHIVILAAPFHAQNCPCPRQFYTFPLAAEKWWSCIFFMASFMIRCCSEYTERNVYVCSGDGAEKWNKNRNGIWSASHCKRNWVLRLRREMPSHSFPSFSLFWMLFFLLIWLPTHLMSFHRRSDFTSDISASIYTSRTVEIVNDETCRHNENSFHISHIRFFLGKIIHPFQFIKYYK